MTQDDFLIEYMTEHYAHARDHEHLLAQITSILSAASSVLIGLAVDGFPHTLVLGGMGLLVVLISVLNLRLNWLHRNRADAHMEAAGAIRDDFETRLWIAEKHNAPSTFRKKFDDVKTGRLTSTWNMVPLLFGVAGAALLAWGMAKIVC